MSEYRQLLAQLAACYGILPEYWDIHGQRHECDQETTRAFLQAFDVACESVEEVQSSLESFARERRMRRAPAVLVLDEGAAEFSLPLLFNDTQLSYAFRIAYEDESEFAGVIEAEQCEETERFLDNGKEYRRMNATLGARLPRGYHRLELVCERTQSVLESVSLIGVPRRCYLPQNLLAQKRAYGLSVQLYSLRSDSNWGVGDFGDLLSLLDFASRQGAAFVGLNPLHAVAPRGWPQISPYNPASREQLNALYIDVAQARSLLEFESERPESEKVLEKLRATEFVSYERVAELKFAALEELYEYFARTQLSNRRSEIAGQYHQFVQDGGEALRSYALFAALQEHFASGNEHVWGWPAWPEEFQNPSSSQVQAFYVANFDRVGFYQFLAWLADRQLRTAVSRGADHGMSVGLYLDIALGSASGGAELWSNQELYAKGVSAGAPPDLLAPQGQNWGLPPFIPHRLTEASYEPFIAVLRASMQFAGAVRIDHVMSLLRLYWVAGGRVAGGSGGYVSYPLDDLIGILALESQRNECLVIGEDLGTVPEEVREAMNQRGVLSYKVLYFEKGEDGDFENPQNYPGDSLVVTSTHDLPTLHGYCSGSDLATRRALQLHDEDVQSELEQGRSADLKKLTRLLQDNGLWESGQVSDVIGEGINPYVTKAVHQLLSRSPSLLQAIQLEDLLFEREQMNLPGTVTEHPNWQRKLSKTIEELSKDARIAEILAEIRQERQ